MTTLAPFTAERELEGTSRRTDTVVVHPGDRYDVEQTSFAYATFVRSGSELWSVR